MAAAGALGCGVTHWAVVPLDVVKTRLQIQPERYSSLLDGVVQIQQQEGWRMLLQGTQATIVGYFLYGLTVYPGYEFFKRMLCELAGPANVLLYRIPLVITAGAIATVITCFFICPFEATRIRLVAEPTFAKGLVPALQRISKEDGPLALYDGLPPLLVRQVLFGMVKFLVFDYCAEIIYFYFPILNEQVSTQLFVSLLSGTIAGVASSIVSQPADVVLSTISKQGGTISLTDGIQQVLKQYGPKGLYLGLGSRCIWSGAIIAGQFFFYDIIKTALQVGSADLIQYLNPLQHL